MLQMVLRGGKSFGRYRHWQPVRKYSNPFRASRMSVVRGRPPLRADGINGESCSTLRRSNPTDTERYSASPSRAVLLST
jgi:hypothetical protein